MIYYAKSRRRQLFSYGGGRQGAAICALIASGRLPRPDAIVIADTSREKQSTWDYLNAVTGPAMASMGLKIEVARHDLSTTDLLAKNGGVQMPMFTRPTGKLPTWCSHEWKRRVIMRWARARWPRASVDVWIGFSTDEIARVKQSDKAWYRHVFPLIETTRLSASDCIRTVANMGWPPPPRSSCWCCPHMSASEWRALPANEWKKAAETERELQRADPNVYLHRDRIPLDQVDLRAQGDLFEIGCSTGYCFT